MILWRAFLVKGLSVCAVDEPLEHVRPVARATNSPVGDREIVLYHLQLGELDVAREIKLIRIGDPDLAPVDG